MVSGVFGIDLAVVGRACARAAGPHALEAKLQANLLHRATVNRLLGNDLQSFSQQRRRDAALNIQFTPAVI